MGALSVVAHATKAKQNARIKKGATIFFIQFLHKEV
jgi:hypothetical protein